MCRSSWISHLDTVVSISWLVKMVRFQVCSCYILKICQQGYTEDVLIVIYLHDLNSVIKMHDLSGFHRISQNLNQSALLWRYVISVHTAQPGAMYSVIVFPLWPSIGTVHRGGASCSLKGSGSCGLLIIHWICWKASRLSSIWHVCAFSSKSLSCYIHQQRSFRASLRVFTHEST